MYDSLAREIECLILAGAAYKDAPNLGSEVLDLIDAYHARFLDYPRSGPPRARAVGGALLADGLLGPYAEAAVHLAGGGLWKVPAFDVTEQFMPRPSHVAEMTRPPSIAPSTRRRRKGGRPTILYDELDTVFGRETAETGANDGD